MLLKFTHRQNFIHIIKIHMINYILSVSAFCDNAILHDGHLNYVPMAKHDVSSTPHCAADCGAVLYLLQ